LRGHECVAGDLANTLVREIEPLAHPMEDAPPYELLDDLRRRAVGEPGAMLEQAEVAFAADDARDRDHAAGGLAQALEPRRDDLPHARRQRGAGVTSAGRIAHGAHRFDDEDRIAGADTPHVLVEARQRALIALGAGQRSREDGGLVSRQRGEREADEARMLAQVCEARKRVAVREVGVMRRSAYVW